MNTGAPVRYRLSLSLFTVYMSLYHHCLCQSLSQMDTNRMKQFGVAILQHRLKARSRSWVQEINHAMAHNGEYHSLVHELCLIASGNHCAGVIISLFIEMNRENMTPTEDSFTLI